MPAASIKLTVASAAAAAAGGAAERPAIAAWTRSDSISIVSWGRHMTMA